MCWSQEAVTNLIRDYIRVKVPVDNKIIVYKITHKTFK